MEPSTIGFIVYLTGTLLLLLILSIKAYSISQWKSKTNFVKAINSMRSIYGAVLVHLYDTSTDIGILIAWSILTYDEISGKHNHKNVNMLSFLIPSIILIFVYRISYATYHWNAFNASVYYLRCDLILILLDLYIFVLVYDQFSLQYISPCMMQKKLQLLESVFESMPQLVLQSIFLIRTYNTLLAESNSIYIVFASILASLLSIVTKLSNDDHEWVTVRARSSHLTFKKCPCISIPYIFVTLWRFCESISRFSIFTLLWAVVGGIYLFIYLLISIVIYFCLEKYTNLIWITNANHTQIKHTQLRILFIYVLQSVVGTALRRRLSMFIIRFIDNCIVLSIIFSFAFIKFDCVLCYDKSERNAEYNPYILILLFLGGITTLLAFIISLGLYGMDIIITTRAPVTVQIVGLDALNDENRQRIRAAAIYPKLYKHMMINEGVMSSDGVTRTAVKTRNSISGIHNNAKHLEIAIKNKIDNNDNVDQNQANKIINDSTNGN